MPETVKLYVLPLTLSEKSTGYPSASIIFFTSFRETGSLKEISPCSVTLSLCASVTSIGCTMRVNSLFRTWNEKGNLRSFRDTGISFERLNSAR